jgi:hypothetical protein
VHPKHLPGTRGREMCRTAGRVRRASQWFSLASYLLKKGATVRIHKE